MNPFSDEVINANNSESVYIAPCSMIEELGSQTDANNAVIRGKANGLTREKSLEKFNNDQAKMFQEKLKNGMVGIKKISGTDLDIEVLEYRELW